MFVLLYLLPCVIVGAIGLGLKDSFWFYFWVSLLFTPIIGLIVVLYDSSRGKSSVKKDSVTHWNAVLPGFRPDKFGWKK